jgi:hypothetical protein
MQETPHSSSISTFFLNKLSDKYNVSKSFGGNSLPNIEKKVYRFKISPKTEKENMQI